MPVANTKTMATTNTTKRNKIKIDATAMKGTTLSEGGFGPAATLAQDGMFELEVVAASINEADEKANRKNAVLNLTLQVLDDDFPGAKGSIIYMNQPITGTPTYEGAEPNIKKIGKLLQAAGRTQAEVDEMSKPEQDAWVFVDKLSEKAVNAEGVQYNRFCAYVAQRTRDDGTVRSEVRYPLQRKKYLDSRASGQGFRKSPNPGGARRRAGGTQQQASNTAPGGTTQVRSQVSEDVADDV